MKAPLIDPFLAFAASLEIGRRKVEAAPDDVATMVHDAECGPLLERMTKGDVPPATTAAGAAAALRLALEADDMEPQDANLARVALAFLERRPGLGAALRLSPEVVEAVAYSRTHGGRMVPVVADGAVQFVSHLRMARVQVADPLPVADYVTGMELLGHSFQVVTHEGRTVVFFGLPEEQVPPAWNAFSLRLEAAFDRQARKAELVAFLRERGDVEGIVR